MLFKDEYNHTKGFYSLENVKRLLNFNEFYFHWKKYTKNVLKKDVKVFVC